VQISSEEIKSEVESPTKKAVHLSLLKPVEIGYVSSQGGKVIHTLGVGRLATCNSDAGALRPGP